MHRDGRQSYAKRLAVDFDCDWAAKVFPISERRKCASRCELLLAWTGSPAAGVRTNFVRNVQLRRGRFGDLRVVPSVRHADPLSRADRAQ